MWDLRRIAKQAGKPDHKGDSPVCEIQIISRMFLSTIRDGKLW